MREEIEVLAEDAALDKLKELLGPMFDAYSDVVYDMLEDEFQDSGEDEDDDIVMPPPPTPKGKLEFIDLLRFKDKPAPSKLGMHNARIIYEGGFWKSKTDHGLPSKASVERHAKSSNGLIIFDIERWADMKNKRGRGYWRVLPEDVKKYVQVMKWAQAVKLPGARLCYYSIMPARNVNDATQHPNSSDYKKWQGWNDEVSEICEGVDLLTPSLYTFGSMANDHDLWERYAIAQIKEAKRISGGKDVMPFLWEKIHPGNKGEVSPKLMRRQLNVIKDHADGVVFWSRSDSKKVSWNDVGDWWDVAEEFIARENRS